MSSLQNALLQNELQEARDNPNSFIEYCFTDPVGKPLQQALLHRELQRFLTENPRAIVELPRDHGKSTQICARILWELGRDPGLRIKVVCASEALAAERSFFLRSAIASNERVRQVFEHLRPGQPWEETRFMVVRPAEVIGASVMAFGIQGASTGARADLLICDDIVDVKAIASRAERERVKQFFRNNLMNLLEPTGRFWGLCTPWHRDDLNAELKRTPSFSLFHRAINEDVNAIWPEKWSTAALLARRAEIGTVSFTRGYRLLPLADDVAMIRADWVRCWSEPREADRIVLSVDPAIQTNQDADRSALVVLAQAGAEIRCLGALARRVTTPDLFALIESFDRLYRPDTILFESNAAFAGIATLLTKQSTFGGKIKAIHQAKSKESRVAAFSVCVENGSFCLQGKGGVVDSSQQELLDEMLAFPIGEHDDLLDAAATGAHYLLTSGEPRIW